MTQNEKIIAQARTWLGTKFKHQGRLKHVGVDCLGLIVGVCNELQISFNGKNISEIDEQNYSFIPSSSQLQNKLEQYLQPVPINQIQPGNILLINFTHNPQIYEPQHLAIISDHPSGLGIIHAYLQAGKVVEHSLDDTWQKRIVKAYKIPE